MKNTVKRLLQPAILGATLVAASFTAQTLYADNVVIPLGQQGNHWNVERPRTGITKQAVEAKYGEPISKSGPVGDPPITTWTYPTFNVYFEYNHVIHSVVKHQPKN